ncbi:huntingtin isoform X2 [Coccinella septempunctata]|uniref:huntingtin isoform X2 n=1 Tax=Coccinella septempunctata TaxID=41139 RepID=UPI001D065F44|nr:huntingtin isoform X2 [Coccinella septempunctata]
MAAQEKLMKSLESLKKIQISNGNSENNKKEKIHHCHVITECISSHAITTVPTVFPTLLNYTMESLFQLCDDADSDIRMVAEESLNKMIRALNDENITKVLIELHKEIKRNNSARTLRAALSRFSKLAHSIRPHKGKPYILHLFPSLIRIIERPEESIHETLASSLPKIIEVLGPFATDNDIKNLLKSFMANISNPSAVIKRTAAQSIQSICLNCPKPYLSIVYCIHIVLGFVFPLNENCDTHLIFGVMGVLKTLLPQWKKYLKESNQIRDRERRGTEWAELKTEKLLQIYELCLHYINSKDHNLVISSLETLNVLLQNSTKELKEALLNPVGLSKCTTYQFSAHKRKSLSQLSISSESTMVSESDLTDSLRPDINKWIDHSKLTLSSLNLIGKPKESLEKSQSLESGSSTISRSLSQIDLESVLEFDAIKTCTSNSSTDLLERTPNSTENCSSNEDITDANIKEIKIGQFEDPDVPLKYCGRLLVKSFLLKGVPNNLINDKLCRVSVKSSALTCLSSIGKIYPQILLEYLDKTVDKPQKDIDQAISDILLYCDHHDPQLRGHTRILLANFLVSVIIKSRGHYDDWLREHSKDEENSDLNFDALVTSFKKGLNDESSICIRHTLQSLELCLHHVLESQSCKQVIPILTKLSDLFNNPYWLVKVNLCDLMCHLPFINIHYVTGDNKFQNKMLLGLQELLKDSDVRVRNAASNTIARLIPQLYFEIPHENTVTLKAISYRKEFLSNLYNKSWLCPFNYKHFVENMPFPFNKIDEAPSEDIEWSLSKVLHGIKEMSLFPNNEYMIMGSIQALATLSQVFPCTIYRKSWNCHFPKNTRQNDQTNDLLELCIDLMTDSTLVYDIGFHRNLLMLCSNIYAGFSICVLKPLPEQDPTKKWSMFESSILSNISDVFLKHIIKILCIYQHIVDDIHLPSQQKSAILSLPTASPMKRRKSDLEKKIISTKTPEEKPEKKEKEKNLAGNFSYSNHYMKIYDSLKTAYGNYKTSLEPSASEKILNMLKETLRSLSILMEIGGLSEFGSIAEEILSYLNSIFRIEPSGSVECVQQLLKSICETNLLANGIHVVQDENEIEKTEIDASGFYFHMFLKPYNEVSLSINALKDINKKEGDGDSSMMGYLHRNAKRKANISTNLDKVLANYIRIFEPMVIRSLEQYTITSDVKLQGKVLQLLSQLVQFKINYCLLDADQIFINFVINQFVHIEEGQILHSEELVPKIFQFLVQLSYSKQHSKSIIGIPKIIQLCDGLTASGQCPLTHCIPALIPIVKDIFLTRNVLNTPDLKELETTREVVLCMLLKLIEYHEIVELIVLILDDSKYCSDTDKWLRWSQSVFNSFLAVLSGNKYRLDSMESFDSLRKLIFALNPNVFRPIDDILLLLFQEPPSLDQDITYFTWWMGRILTVLIILSPVKEDIILAKISALKNNFIPSSVFENIVVTPDPLNVTNSADFFQYLAPEKILILFIFRTLSLATKKCTLLVEEDEDVFFVKELSIFMMFCLHNFQSGFLCKTANVAISLIEKSKYAEECDAINIQPINEYFQSLTFFYPTLTFHWCYFLTLLGYEDLTFWSSNLQLPLEDGEKTMTFLSSINTDVVKVGGSIVFCDYLCENSSKRIDIVNWVLKNNLELLINLDQEAPINEFFSFIHRDSKLSGMLLKYIGQQLNILDSNLIFNLKVLKAIENTHPNLTGQMIKLLMNKFIYISDSAVIKEVSKLATRKVELLLTMSADSIHRQLKREDLLEITHNLNKKNFCTKFESLLGLLGKLGIKFYDFKQPFIAQRRIIDPEIIKDLNIDKEWYLSQLKHKLSNVKMGKEVARMLSMLTYSEQLELIGSEYFDGQILKYCIDCGVEHHQNHQVEEIPDILKASIQHMCKEVNRIVEDFWKQNQSGNFSSFSGKDLFRKSEHNLNSECLSVAELSKILSYLIPSVVSYLKAVPKIPLLEVDDVNSSNIIKLNIISFRLINYIIDTKRPFDVMLTSVSLDCLNSILKQDKCFTYLNSKDRFTWSCSLISDVYKIKLFLTEDEDHCFESTCGVIPENIINKFENSEIAESCSHLYSLINWIFLTRKQESNIPDFFISNLNSIINSLGRLSLFNSCMLIPSKAWDRGLDASSFSFQNPVISLPVELLQDREILEDYLFRITLLGWNSRQQFEETWMCLLSVLCNSPSDDNSAEESNEIYTTISLALKGITSMLFQTMYYPVPGKKNHSVLLSVSRDEPILGDKMSMKKLKDIQTCIRNKYNGSPYFSGKNVKMNIPFDESNMQNFFPSGQMSIKYFLIALGILENIDDKCLAYQVLKRRDKVLECSGLDITSCLHFLQDFFTQLLQYQNINSLVLLHESVISILVLSDLFTDKSQFSWMMDLFMDLLKLHAVEDELLHLYLIVGVCKAAAILNPELEVYETVKKYLSTFLKSSYIPSRLACLHGLLFILEGCKLNNISIGGISEELQLILPCAVEYLQNNLIISNNIPQSQEHTLAMWSVAFYIIENIDETHLGPGFVEDAVSHAISVVSKSTTGIVEYKFVMQKLQRLIAQRRNILENFGKKIVKVAFDGLKSSNSFIAVTSIQLLFTYMYIEYAEHVESSNEQSSPEILVQTVEKFSALFEYIKRGYIFEAEIVCSLLPQVLDDFFTPADILTKVIGEFLSAQQPHQKFLSKVVFHLFQSAIRQNQLTLLQDWIVFSLPNFTQNFSYPMATWCLTCFFISASRNQWLTALFPYIQTRIQRYEYEDREILCVAGSDFYKNLSTEKQKDTFKANFKMVKNLPDMPFSDLLSSL